MTNQGGDRCLGEPKVIGNAGEPVSQNMRCDAGQVGLFE
jgi:hypothetical protein